jgi:hypothetical protein
MAQQTILSKTGKYLQRTIDAIINHTGAERDLYAYVRDLLTIHSPGPDWKRENIVIDSSVGSGIPDIIIYPNGLGGKPNKAPYNAAVIFEGKTNDQVRQKSQTIFEEKKKYIQLSTKWMVLFDQIEVQFRGIGNGKWDEIYSHEWQSLKNPDYFYEAFSRISARAFDIGQELLKFREGRTSFAWMDVNFLGTDKFLQVVREISRLLRDQITRLVDTRAVEELKMVNAEVDKLKPKYGPPEFRIAGHDSIHIEFPKIQEIAKQYQDPSEKINFIDVYDRAKEYLLIQTAPYQWALKIEHLLLPKYASKIGMEGTPSLLSSSKDIRKVRDSFIYETASFILARMLLIRFSEDNNFLDRYVSNGGIPDFVSFARRFKQGYQFLLKEAYKLASELYRNVFDESSLDWILNVRDPTLHDTIEYSLYLLSEFDFRTVKGDILSGVYDGLLEKNKRKALGEYYTRPEVARYILERCEYDSSKTFLDPAVGTGTFAVEALYSSIEEMRKRGMLDNETIRTILGKLSGLDINIFAIALAQVQFFWHLFELFQGKSREEVRSLASSLIPSINLCGGQSSLEMAGILFSGQEGFAYVEPRSPNGTGETDPKWLRIMRGTYHVCAGNPPWIRAHRISLSTSLQEQYDDVYEKQIDLSGLFLYKALRQWVKPGGYAGFILPYSTLESESAEKLRTFLKTKTIVEIVDMELVASRVFDADTVPIILIVKNERNPTGHKVRVSILTDDAYNELEDKIDFSKARVISIPLDHLLTESYGNTTTKKITPKVYPEDVDVLKKIGKNPRVHDKARRLWINTKDKTDVKVAESKLVPQGYREHTLTQRGLEIGGSSGFSGQGVPVFKGANVFPEAILGEPSGLWNLEDKKITSINIFKYSVFLTESTYVTRRLSQVPVAGKWSPDIAFNDSTHLISFEKPFPLNVYLLSRIPQFFAFKTLRTEVMLRRRAVWNVAELQNIPVPEQIDVQQIEQIGSILFQHSNDILNKYRHVQQIIENSRTYSLRDCIMDKRLSPDVIDLTGFPEDIRVRSDEITCKENRITGGLFVDIRVLDGLLLDYLAYFIAEILSDEYVDKSVFLDIPIPIDNLSKVVEAINTANKNKPEEKYQQEIEALDYLVGGALGLTNEEIAYVVGQFHEDPFLKRINPNMPHLGMKFQAYRSNYGRDGQRYL